MLGYLPNIHQGNCNWNEVKQRSMCQATTAGIYEIEVKAAKHGIIVTNKQVNLKHGTIARHGNRKTRGLQDMGIAICNLEGMGIAKHTQGIEIARHRDRKALGLQDMGITRHACEWKVWVSQDMRKALRSQTWRLQRFGVHNAWDDRKMRREQQNGIIAGFY